MTRPTPARAVFLGSGAFAVPSLERLAALPEVDLRAVVTAPARPAGRRGSLAPTPVDEAARRLGLAVLAPERLRAPETIEAVRAVEPDVAVLADYGQLVPPALLDLPLGALNLHPSLLPRHRGATPIPAAIAAGDAATGVTLFRMDEGLDSGPVVAAVRVAIEPGEGATALAGRLAAVAADLLEATLPGWLQGTVPVAPQDDAAATLTRPHRRADGRLDPTRPAEALARQVRALEGWPGTFVETPFGRLIVRRGAAVEGGPGDVAGRIVADADGIALATSGGRLRLDEVQPAGRAPMSGAAYRRGRPAIVGTDVA